MENQGTNPMGGMQVSEADKQMHNKLYGLSAQILYDEAFLPKIKAIFEKAPTPAIGATSLLVSIGSQILNSARQGGEEISGVALLTSGWMIMQEIAELVEAKLGVKMTDEQIEGAFYNAADQMQEIISKHGGVNTNMSPEDRRAFLEANENADAQRENAMAVNMPTAPAPPPQRGLNNPGGM